MGVPLLWCISLKMSNSSSQHITANPLPHHKTKRYDLGQQEVLTFKWDFSSLTSVILQSQHTRFNALHMQALLDCLWMFTLYLRQALSSMLRLIFLSLFYSICLFQTKEWLNPQKPCVFQQCAVTTVIQRNNYTFCLYSP